MRLIILGLVAVLVGVSIRSALDSGFGSQTPGRHVYDRAGVLSQQQLGALESKVASVGAPTIVYIRVKAATSQQQMQVEARALMQAWNVQSSAGAGDGVVLLLDLDPANHQRAQLGLVAGSDWSRALPSAEIDRIITRVKGPSLVRGDLAGSIGARLDAIATSIQSGLATAPTAAPRAAAPSSSGAPGPFDWIVSLTSSPDWFSWLFMGLGAINVLWLGAAVLARIAGGRDPDGRYRGLQIGRTGFYFASGGYSLVSRSGWHSLYIGTPISYRSTRGVSRRATSQ